MNFPVNYDDYKEPRKTHPLLLTKIETGTKGGKLNKDPVGDSFEVVSGSAKNNVKAVKFLPGTNKGLTETQVVNGCVVNKDAER